MRHVAIWMAGLVLLPLAVGCSQNSQVIRGQSPPCLSGNCYGGTTYGGEYHGGGEVYGGDTYGDPSCYPQGAYPEGAYPEGYCESGYCPTGNGHGIGCKCKACLAKLFHCHGNGCYGDGCYGEGWCHGGCEGSVTGVGTAGCFDCWGCVPPTYPSPGSMPGIVQYPYYTLKGPDCFFHQN